VKISQTNNTAKKFISMLLLLCISVTIVPFNILHHHNEKETHCDLTNENAENNPCHISIYHANDFQKPHCEHKTHIDKKHNHCEFCKFVTSSRVKYIANKRYSFIPTQLSEANITFECSFSMSTFLGVIFSRGPPA